MMQFPVIHLLLILGCIGLFADGSITWTLQNEYVSFGDDAILTCDTTKCSPSSMRKWIGGKDYKLLSFNGSSTDLSKYEIRTHNSTLNLVIKKFDLTDINCRYTCACGFSQYTKELTVDNMNVIYNPTIPEIIDNSSSNGGGINLQIRIQKIYPLPHCIVLYRGVWQDEMSMKNKTIYSGNIELFEVDLQYSFKTDHTNCTGNIKVVCNLVWLNRTCSNMTLNTCSDSVTESLDAEVVVAVVLGIVLVSLVSLTVAAILVCVKKRCHRKNPPADDPVKEEDETSFISVKTKDTDITEKINHKHSYKFTPGSDIINVKNGYSPGIG